MSTSPHPPPLTVLFVDHAPALGGAEHSLLGLLSALDRGRVRPVLAAVPGPLAEAARASGVTVHTLPLRQLKGHATAILRLARGVLALAALIRREQVDIVHANVLRAAVYAAPAARLTGRPLVWHVRDILASDRTTRALCGQAAAVIAISEAVRRALPCAGRACVIYNPVAVLPAQARTRAELGLPEDGLLVASVGRMREWKGHDAFLEAAARVRHPQAGFVVIGGRLFGEDRDDLDLAERLEARAAVLGLSDRMTFTGHRGDLADIWPHLAVVAHTAEAEPFGRVVAEAQLAGLPVVAFRDGGVPEIVAGGETGLLVPAGDVGALAGAVDRLLDDAELRSRMGAAGRARAAERFDPAEHARAVVGVYDGVVRSQLAATGSDRVR